MLIQYLNQKADQERGGPPMSRERVDDLAKQYPDTPNTRRKKVDG